MSKRFEISPVNFFCYVLIPSYIKNYLENYNRKWLRL